jgi:hypothetical protein
MFVICSNTSRRMIISKRLLVVASFAILGVSLARADEDRGPGWITPPRLPRPPPAPAPIPVPVPAPIRLLLLLLLLLLLRGHHRLTGPTGRHFRWEATRVGKLRLSVGSTVVTIPNGFGFRESFQIPACSSSTE